MTFRHALIASFCALRRIRKHRPGTVGLVLSGAASLVAAFSTFMAGPAAVSAAGPCTYLTGEERRQCSHDEVVARTQANRAAADRERAVYKARDAERQRAEDAQIIFTDRPSPTRTYGNKLRFADPRSIWKRSYNESLETNKQLSAEWMNRNDPGFIALRSAIERGFPLWDRANRSNSPPATYTLQPGRLAGEVFIAFGKGGIQAQLVEGNLCLGNAETLYKTCDDIPSSMAEADRLRAESVARGIHNAQEADNAKREAALVIAGSRTRRPGSPLNAEDEACMKTFSEEFQDYAEGQCTSSYRTRLDNGTPGPTVCTAHEGHMVTRTRNFEKNICSRVISFKDQCGSTIFQTNAVKPGARFDRKFGYPCGRVY